MDKPALVIMAAGMGSRYGGLKQIDPVGEHGEVIMDYSIYDALKAGFKKIIIVIKKEIEEDFKQVIGNRIEKVADVHYAYQQLDNLPVGYNVPNTRTKPWGTAQAVLSAKNLIDGPFAVINADDYYGPSAFKDIYEYLCTAQDTPTCFDYAMVAYNLQNTITEHGHVARGICAVAPNGYLFQICERTRIEKTDTGASYTENDGTTWVALPSDTVVSMNLWGFTKSFLCETEKQFSAFLDTALVANPLKSEYFLPTVISNLLADKKASVKVLQSADKWYGVTYAEDKPVVIQAIKQKTSEKIYPSPLWG